MIGTRTDLPRSNAQELGTPSIRLGAISQAPRLGGYYLDTREIIPFVESGRFGPIDERGVPLLGIASGEAVDFAVLIAQYALALHDRLLKHGDPSDVAKLTAQLDTLAGLIQGPGENHGFVLHGWKHAKYTRLAVPWVSALSQGQGISALLRGFQLLHNPSYLEGATAMFHAMGRSVSDGGVLHRDDCGHLWFEEYPMEPPIHVLNGFLFALWGVLDFARATGDPLAWQWWKSGSATLSAHLPEYHAGFWSRYDLGHRELATIYYHKQIHVPQMQAMFGLTGEPLYSRFAARWHRLGRNPLALALWWVAVRVQAHRRGRRFD